MLIKKKLLMPIIILLILSGCTSTDAYIESGQDITMYIATDIHYFPKSLTDYSSGYEEFATPGDGKQLYYIEEITDAFIDEIKNNKPDLLVLSGDLTNNGEKISHMELSAKLKEIEQIGTTVLVVPGNHDLQSMWARGFKDSSAYPVETVTHQEFTEIYSDYGYKDAISRDESSLSYLAAPSEDIWLLMIDSNEYFAEYGMPTNHGIISTETMEWIKECSKRAKENGAEIIAVMHHNLLNHSVKMKEATALDNSNEVVELFKELGIRLTFSGHIHIQDIKTDNIENPTIYDVVNSAISVYPQQYGVLKYSQSEGFDYFKAKVDVNSWAKSKGLDDKALLNFSEYSREAFGSRPYDNAVNELIKLETYSDDQIIDIATMVRDLNLRYFEGTIFEIRQDLMATKLYKDFIDIESEYLYDFVYSMIHNGNLDCSKLKLPPLIH